MPLRTLCAALLVALAACGGEESPDPTGAPVAASISLSPSSIELAAPGDTVTVTAVVTDTEGGSLSAAVTWYSDDTDVLTVDDGLVTAVGPGLTTIHAEADGVEGSIPGGVLEYLVYVALSDRNQMMVIDSRTNEVVDSVSVGSGPWGLAVSPDGATAYVANLSADSVAIVDLATRSVSATVAVTGLPVDVGMTPDGSSIFVVNDNEWVSIIDGDTYDIFEIAAADGSLRGIALSPDGSMAYVPDLSESQLLMIDVASKTVVDSVSVGTNPRAIAVTHSGEEAIIADMADSVTILDLATKSVVEVLAVGSNPRAVAVTPDDALAYVGNNAGGDVWVMDLATLTIVDTLDTGGGFVSNSIAFTPDGARGYVASATNAEVAVIDVQTGIILARTEVDGLPRGVGVAPPPQSLGSGGGPD